MGCKSSKASKVSSAPASKTPGLLVSGTDQPVVAKPPGKAMVHGVPGSLNCMGPILLVTTSGCGQMEACTPYVDTAKPEFLAVNPFHTVPALRDGDFCIGESNAILRFLAESYVPDAYPSDAKLRGVIDWAMNRFSSVMYADSRATVYPILGYAGPPDDQAAAGKLCSDNLKEFADVFLKGKFVGGDQLSIADYKVAPFFFSYEHATAKEKGCVDCPDRIKEFNKDFAAACKNEAADMLSRAGGYSLKELMDLKLEAPKKDDTPPAAAAEAKKEGSAPTGPAAETKRADSPPAPAAESKKEDSATAAKQESPPVNKDGAKSGKGECLVYGATGSLNSMGAIMLVTGSGCGKLQVTMPYVDTNAPDFLKINPFHAVPAFKDGEYCLGESDAILRYVATTYAPDAYPTADAKLRGFINFALDRFSGTMYADAVATVYPILGYAGPPEDQAAAGKMCSTNLREFADVFLKQKFIGGEKPSIADYKVAPFFFSYEHAAAKEKGCVDCPDRIKEFNKAFAVACGEPAMMLTSAGGFSLKEMLDAKLEAADASMATGEDGKANAGIMQEPALALVQETEDKGDVVVSAEANADGSAPVKGGLCCC